jgi:Ribbon-helix-helix protein, copG family
MKKTTIWLSEADLELRDQLAAQLGTTASEVIRRALYQLAAFRNCRIPKPKKTQKR